MEQQKIIPIENFIFEGIVKRLQQTFGCYTQYCNAPSTLIEMQKIRARKINFPYLLFNLTGMNSLDEFYNSNYLSRSGVVVADKSANTISKVKLLPCKFDFNCNYYTNTNAGDNSALFFMKRWLFARRLGYLKFTIKYGDNTYGCHVELDESVSLPERDPEPEGPNWFKLDCRFSVVGFISEAEVLSEGRVTTIKTELKVNSTLESNKDYYWKSYGKSKKR